MKRLSMRLDGNVGIVNKLWSKLKYFIYREPDRAAYFFIHQSYALMFKTLNIIKLALFFLCCLLSWVTCIGCI